MSFYIPAAVAASVNAGGFPPGTGYYPVEVTQVEDRGVTDKQGNYSYFIHLKFLDGSTTRSIGSCPFNAEGELAPALAAMDKVTQDKKVGGMVGALKRVAVSCGITEEYMAENGLSTVHLVGRTAYIEWLGRPEDTPKGVKAYGDIKNFINKDVYEKYTEAGAKPEDTRQFPWRRNAGVNNPSGGASHTANNAGSALPPPPPAGRAKLPPPPQR